MCRAAYTRLWRAQLEPDEYNEFFTGKEPPPQRFTLSARGDTQVGTELGETQLEAEHVHLVRPEEQNHSSKIHWKYGMLMLRKSVECSGKPPGPGKGQCI